jgi:PAS domain S-box-containing protein/diguanylate cyclase (GGDEF)-like protein
MKNQAGINKFQLNEIFGYEMHQLFDKMPVSVFVKTVEGEHLFANQMFCDMVGYTREEILGRKDLELFSREEALHYLHQDQMVVESDKQTCCYDFQRQGVEIRGEKLDFLVHKATINDPSSNEVVGIFGLAIDKTKENTFYMDLKSKANHDELTGLPNEKSMSQVLEAAMADPQPYGVFVTDWSGIGGINETVGFAFGDRLLISLANRLGQVALGKNGQVFRLKMDGFALVLPLEEKKSERVARELALEFEEYNFEGLVLSQGVQIGFAEKGDSVKTSSQWVNNARLALNSIREEKEVKWIRYSSSLKQKRIRRFQLENRLRSAVEEQKIYVVYQPIMEMKSGEISKVEALARWKDSELGDISPSEFIPIAESNGSIMQIGEFVMEEAFAMIAEINAGRKAPIRMALNLSIKQMEQVEFAEQVLKMAARYQLDPKWIELEVTENLKFDCHGVANDNLNRLDEEGFSIVIDDFGNGYAAMERLMNRYVKQVKVSQFFTERMMKDINVQKLVSYMVVLSKQMGLKVVAEGVETLEQLKFYQEHQVDFIQGFYYYRPALKKSIHNWLVSTEE